MEINERAATGLLQRVAGAERKAADGNIALRRSPEAESVEYRHRKVTSPLSFHRKLDAYQPDPGRRRVSSTVVLPRKNPWGQAVELLTSLLAGMFAFRSWADEAPWASLELHGCFFLNGRPRRAWAQTLTAIPSSEGRIGECDRRCGERGNVGRARPASVGGPRGLAARCARVARVGGQWGPCARAALRAVSGFFSSLASFSRDGNGDPHGKACSAGSTAKRGARSGHCARGDADDIKPQNACFERAILRFPLVVLHG